MKTGTKSMLLLFSTLLIGMALGSLLTGAINQHRLERLAEMRSARGMAYFLEDVIRPESTEQREAIRAVLDSAAPKFAAAMQESREKMRALTDSVRAELDPLLTDEQRDRMDDRMRIGRGGQPFGPPGARGPDDDRRRRRPHPDGGRPPPPEGGI
jgi:hypothetical protein